MHGCTSFVILEAGASFQSIGQMLEITVEGALVGLAKFPPSLPLEDGEHNHTDQPGKPGGLFEVPITNTILIGSHKNPGTKTEFVRFCVDVWTGLIFQLLKK